MSAQQIPQEIYNQISTFLGKESFEYITNDEGCDNLVYIIDDTYILRLSKYQDHSFQQEIDLINYISRNTDISIPVSIIHGENHQRFMYKKLIGSTTDISQRLQQLKQDHYNNLVRQLAGFMNNMHELVNHRQIINIGVKAYDKSRNNYKNLQILLSQLEEHSYKKRIQHLLDTYEQYQQQNTQITLGLLHNDLYGNHFLTDLTTGSITGVIDFTDIAIGDIQLDFMFLYDPHTNFQNDVIDLYSQISKKNINKEFVLLCTQIFITYHYLKYRRTTKERTRAKDRVDNRIKEKTL